MPSYPAFIEEIVTMQVMGLIGGLVLLMWIVSKTWGFVRRTVLLLDDLLGSDDSPSLSARISLMEESLSSQASEISSMKKSLTAQADQTKRIHHEVLPNHGDSLRDQVDRVKHQVDEVRAYQKADYERLEAHLGESEQAQAQVARLAQKVRAVIDRGEESDE